MKNFQATRGKIKNYLDALKQRFSTSEWNHYQAHEITKEFGVTVTLPQILKKDGYYHYEHKEGKPLMMLSSKIFTLDEYALHEMIREYQRQSKNRLELKKLKKRASNKLYGSKNKYQKEEDFKVMSIRVGRNFYNSILEDCRKKDITVSRWVMSKLVSGEFTQPMEKPRNLNLELVRKTLLGNTQEKPKSKKRGRPLTSQFNKPMVIKETVFPITPVTEVYSSKTTHTLESAETKIKSLETIMNLFSKGIINNEELQTLKVGILNK